MSNVAKFPEMRTPQHELGKDLRDGDDLYLVNERTGETLDHWRYDARAKPDTSDWIRLYQRMTFELAMDSRLTLAASKLFLYVVGKASFGNSIKLNGTVVSKSLGYSRRTHDHALKVLLDIGVIERKGTKVGAYKLNPNYGWKGKNGQRHNELKRAAAKELANAESKLTVNTGEAGD